jgi:hypothetical protein
MERAINSRSSGRHAGQLVVGTLRPPQEEYNAKQVADLPEEACKAQGADGIAQALRCRSYFSTRSQSSVCFFSAASSIVTPSPGARGTSTMAVLRDEVRLGHEEAARTANGVTRARSGYWH